MTDARFPETWLADRRIQKLSDIGFRLFANALMWSVSNKTDGLLEYSDLTLIPGYAAGREDELADCGLWATEARGWMVSIFAQTQTSRAEHEALGRARKSNRERQARWRTNQSNVAGDVTCDVASDVISHVDGDVTRNALSQRYGENGSDPKKRNGNVTGSKTAGRKKPIVTNNVSSNATKSVTAQDRIGSALSTSDLSPSLKDEVRKSGTSLGPPNFERPPMSITTLAGGCERPPDPPPPDRGERADAAALVREMVRGHPAAVLTMLRVRASEMLNQDIDPAYVRQGLRLWLDKPHLGPNVLPSLVSEAIRRNGCVPATGGVDQKIADLQNLGDRLTAQQEAAISMAEIEGTRP